MRIALALFAALMLAACQKSGEAPYPSKEIKLIVQAAPGGLSDTISRIVGSLAEKQLGVPVVCENKPGASGALAFSYVARRPADGYTIGHAPVELAVVRALGYGQVGPADVDLLCLVTKTQACLAVPVGSPWQSFDDFAQAVKTRPNYYVVGNSGTGSIWHINAMLMERNTGLEIIHLPFTGSSGSLTSALGGHIDAVVAGVGEVVPHVEAGRMRILAIFSESRSGLYPDIPSSHELGYPFGVNAWSGFFAPKGLDPAVRDKLVNAIREAYDTEQFRQISRERGLEPSFLGPEEFSAFALEQARFFESELGSLMAAGN